LTGQELSTGEGCQREENGYNRIISVELWITVGISQLESGQPNFKKYGLEIEISV